MTAKPPVARLGPLVALLGCIGCSTLAPEPPAVECTGNEIDECADGFVCELGICRDASDLAPLKYIGFDLQELASGQAQFRAEIAGCDREVLGSGAAVQVLSLPRAEVARTLILGAYVSAPTDEDPAVALPATLSLAAGSRFNRDGLRRQVSYPPAADETATEVAVAWPRYYAENDLPGFLGADGFVVWETQPLPGEDLPAPASRLHLLVPPTTIEGESCVTDLDCCADPATCDAEDVRNACVPTLGECRVPSDEIVTYTYVYADGCDRQLRGRVVRVNEAVEVLGPLPGASVTIRHQDDPGDRLGIPPLDQLAIEDRASECTTDLQCLPQLFCNTETEQCELPLQGQRAWSGTAPIDAIPGAEGTFSARTFTYCEGLPPGEPLTRTFSVVVTPPADELGLPTMNLFAEIDFDPIQAGQKPAADFDGDLCIPDWGPAQDLNLSPQGEPRTLIPGYACCDLDCLPRTEDDAASGPPEARSQCNGVGSGSAPTYRIETNLIFSEETVLAWTAEDSPCIRFSSDETGAIGTLRRSAACGTIDENGVATPSCDLAVPAGPDGSARAYALRIETPTGSVTGSVDTSVSVTETAGSSLLEVELPRRTLLRGRVLLDPDSCDREAGIDCGSPGAKVLAERLRMMGESVGNTPGPYFHEVSTFFNPTAASTEQDGAYVLPLDPGVWVITALPDSGTPGGPARLVLVDLRDAPEVAEQDLVVEDGILVTLDVETFDRRAQVLPLDIGSWLLPGDSQLVHPDREAQPAPGNLVDLGAEGECLARAADANVTPGCRIRRLIGGSALPPTQVGQVRFTARDLDSSAAVDCR